MKRFLLFFFLALLTIRLYAPGWEDMLPVSMVLKSPSGKTVSSLENQISGAVYRQEADGPLVDEIEIANPERGEFMVQVVGREKSEYSLIITGCKEWQPVMIKTIGKGETHFYAIDCR